MSLTELPEISSRMSKELQDDYSMQGWLLSSVFILCVFGAIGFSALLLTIQIASNRRERLRNERNAKARRLMRMIKGKGMEEILAPPIDPRCFHLFLSHVWSSVRIDQDLSPSRSLDPRTSGRATYCSALPST